jgi:hypothetical protein
VNARRPGWFVLVVGYLQAAARLRLSDLSLSLVAGDRSIRDSPGAGARFAFLREPGAKLI